MKFIESDHRIYNENENGVLIAEVTFPFKRNSKEVVDINHTYVDPDLRGGGIANELLLLAVAKIKENGWKAVPTCPYAAKWFEKNKEYSDLLEK